MMLTFVYRSFKVMSTIALRHIRHGHLIDDVMWPW